MRHAIPAVIGILALTAAPVDAQQRFNLTGDEVVIYNIAGQLRVERGTSSHVEVEVTPRGDDAGRLRVETGPIRDRSSLRVIYPAERIRYSGEGWRGNTTLRVRGDGTFGSGGRRVRVGSGGGLDAHADLVVRIPAGKRVALMLGVGEVRGSDLEGDLVIDVAAANVSIGGFRGALLIDTGSGRVEATDVVGALSIDTGSGSVEARRVRGERLHIDTGSGGVSGGEIEVDHLIVDTGSGSIKLEGVGAPRLKLDTGSGRIEASLTRDIDDGRIDTGSGSVRLEVPSTFGARLDIDTGSGSIDVDGLRLEVFERGRTELKASVGDGQGRLVIDTGSGGVRIRGR